MFRKNRVLILVIAIIFLQFRTWGQESAKNSKYSEPLNFAAEKSNIQILPQKFEFTLVDSHKMKLGDILIDAAQVNLDLVTIQNKNDKQYKLTFTWPAALLSEGQVILLNNYGKSIWSSRIQKQNIKINQSLTNDTTLRAEIASITSSEISPKVINEMKYLPFMKFCVVKLEDDTRLQLCSREFYLSGQKDDLALKPRANVKKTAELSINNKIINSGQALIFLNNPDQNINLKARAESGSFLEFETRMQPVEFQDAFLNDDGKTIQIRASGANPVKENSVEFIGDKLWKSKIPVTDPVLYLKAAGGIPMRQEFFIRGTVPTQNLRPYAIPPIENKTYSSHAYIYGKAATKTSPVAKDKNIDLSLTENGEFIWELKNLESDNENKRYLTFKTDKSEFSIFHKVYKGKSFQVKSSAMIESPSGLLRGRFSFDWWFQNFLWLSNDWSNFRWGLQLEQTQALSKKDTLIDYTMTRASLMYRFSSGFHFTDATWGIKIPFQILKTSVSSFSSPGIGIFYFGPNPGFRLPIYNWYELELLYFSGAKSDTENLKSSYELSNTFYYKINKLFAFNYGIGIIQNNFETNTESAKLQIQGKLGIAISF